MSDYLKRILVLFFFFSICGCKSVDVKTHSKLELKFLSEFIVSNDIMVDETQVGGLSGIDYYNGIYYLACDNPTNPRYYEATITLNESSISNITFDKVVKIQDTSKYFDLESILYSAKTNQVLLTSEGHINTNKDPLFK